jgi:hypothetical protein
VTLLNPLVGSPVEGKPYSVDDLMKWGWKIMQTEDKVGMSAL